MQEVIGLEQHVTELRERQPAVHAGLHRLLLHHHIDREVLSDVPEEIDESLLHQPLRVVEHKRRGRSRAEIQEARRLIALATNVLPDLFLGEKWAFARFPGGIADQAGAAAHQHDRSMAGALQIGEQHQRHQVAELQRGRVIIATVLALLYGSGLAYGSWTRVCAAERCPSITRIDPHTGHNVQLQTSKVYAADGRLITELGIERRTVLPLEEIPLFVRQAFIAVEDKRFYAHHGIDYWRILGAVKADLLSLSWAQGFSTIPMQLARNVFPERLGREKRLTRKLREARVAVELERNFPKDTILELYLNQISLGPNVAGVEAASQVFFGKSARDLNVAEAATLAALPKAPGNYNPRTHPDRAVARRNVVLTLMSNQGYLTPEDAEYWKAYPLVLTSRRTSYGDVAPYFVEWLRASFLEPRFGRDLYEKGLRIYTTLDLDMQEAAERALQSQLDEIEAGAYSPNAKFEGQGHTYREYVEKGRPTGEDQGPFSPYLQG